MSKETDTCPRKWLKYLEHIFCLLISSRVTKMNYCQFSQSKRSNINHNNIAINLLKTVQIVPRFKFYISSTNQNALLSSSKKSYWQYECLLSIHLPHESTEPLSCRWNLSANFSISTNHNSILMMFNDFNVWKLESGWNTWYSFRPDLQSYLYTTPRISFNLIGCKALPVSSINFVMKSCLSSNNTSNVRCGNFLWWILILSLQKM